MNKLQYLIENEDVSLLVLESGSSTQFHSLAIRETAPTVFRGVCSGILNPTSV